MSWIARRILSLNYSYFPVISYLDMNSLLCRYLNLVDISIEFVDEQNRLGRFRIMTAKNFQKPSKVLFVSSIYAKILQLNGLNLKIPILKSILIQPKPKINKNAIRTVDFSVARVIEFIRKINIVGWIFYSRDNFDMFQ